MILKSLWVCWIIIKVIRVVELSWFEASKIQKIGTALSRQMLKEKLQREQPAELMIEASFWVLVIVTLIGEIWT